MSTTDYLILSTDYSVRRLRRPGGVTERTNVLVLKTSEAQASEGSNPSPSAVDPASPGVLSTEYIRGPLGRVFFLTLRGGGTRQGDGGVKGFT